MADAIPVGRKVSVKKEAELASGSNEYIDNPRENVGDAKDFESGAEGRTLEASIEIKKGDDIVPFVHSYTRVDH